MLTITVDIRGDKELAASLDALSSNLKIGLEEALDEAADRIKQEMKHQAPKFTGALADSIDVIERSQGMRAIGPGGSEGSTSRPLPKAYALYVEEGRRPQLGDRMPNIEDIANRFAVDTAEAVMIARKIRETPGRADPFVTRTFANSQGIFENTVNRMVTFAIR